MENVTFATRVSIRYQLRYKDEDIRPTAWGRIQVIPQQFIVFKDGKFITNDPEKIAYVRECDAYRRKEIFEITPDDKQSLMPKPSVTRGAISTGNIRQEAGVKAENEPVALDEHFLKCDFPGCIKECKNERSLRMHKMYHRPGFRKKETGVK